MRNFIRESHCISCRKSGWNQYKRSNGAPATDQHHFTQDQHSWVMFPQSELCCPQLLSGIALGSNLLVLSLGTDGQGRWMCNLLRAQIENTPSGFTSVSITVPIDRHRTKLWADIIVCIRVLLKEVLSFCRRVLWRQGWKWDNRCWARISNLQVPFRFLNIHGRLFGC